MSARALMGVAGTTLALWAGLTAAALIWIMATDPLRAVAIASRMLSLLW
jgi:hypothetical protein